MEKDEAQFKKMTQTPIPKLVASLAFPATVSMLITSIYNLADTFFVSQLDTSASGAVGVVFSLMTIIQAVGFTLGMGSGSLLSRRLGGKDKKAADMYASSAFYLAILLGAVIALFGKLFTKQLMTALGATETILPYAVAYGNYILYAAPVMSGSFVLNNLLRSEGKASLAMVGLVTGGILNIILDPIFIFSLNMGTAGAALATLISQCISFVILLSMFIFKKSSTSLSPKNITFKPKAYLEIVSVGMPSLSRQGLASVATILLNRMAMPYGDAAIAGMSIVGKVSMLVLCICLGVGQGFMPVAGYNYGAKIFGRVRKSFQFTVITATILMTVMAIVCYALAPNILRLFRAEDADVVTIGTAALRAQCYSMPFLATSVCTNMVLQSLGKSVRATILSCCRQGIFFIPLIMILPKYIGIAGVEFTQAISDVLTFFVSIPLILIFLKGLKKEEQNAEKQI
ncbi:MAG: MATE family efflux transporter [Clostridiales bacterium]|nr:MATE family efflux transporter [Clostridiales bacterium]